MIGIDVAKKTLAVCCWEVGQAQPSWEASYPNTAAGLQELLAAAPATLPWVVEPTGSYSESVVRAGQAAGRKVLMAPPLAAKRFLQSLTPRAKTDKADARGLACYGQQARLRPFRLKEAPLQRLWAVLQGRSKLARVLASLRQQQRAFPELAFLSAPVVGVMEAQLQAYDRELERAGRQLELFRRLLKVPGIGAMNAAGLTVRLSSIDFPSYDAFIAYVGLDLRVRESGAFRGRRRLSKHGDATLRWLLFMAARATLVAAQGTDFQALYERKLAQGFSKTAAACILARKLAKVAWAMARSGEDYDPTRVFSARRP